MGLNWQPEYMTIAGRAVRESVRLIYLYKNNTRVFTRLLYEIRIIHSEPEDFVIEGQRRLAAMGSLYELTPWLKFYHEVLKVAGDQGYIEAMGLEYFHQNSHLGILDLSRENVIIERYLESSDKQAFWWYYNNRIR